MRERTKSKKTKWTIFLFVFFIVILVISLYGFAWTSDAYDNSHVDNLYETTAFIAAVGALVSGIMLAVSSGS